MHHDRPFDVTEMTVTSRLMDEIEKDTDRMKKESEDLKEQLTEKYKKVEELRAKLALYMK